MKLEPTCTETGLTEGKHCSRCNEVLVKQEIINAKGHNYKLTVINPTCVDKGYTLYTCECNDTYIDNYVNELGHIYSDWYIVSNPTCTESGLKQRDCNNCDYNEIEKIEMIGHNYTCTFSWNKNIPSFNVICLNDNNHNQTLVPEVLEKIIKEATKTEEGLKEYSASITFEGKVYSDKIQEKIPMIKQEVGDIDGNEQINTDDVVYLLMNSYFPEDYPVEQKCDFNNDTEVNTDDVVYLLMHLYFPEDYPINKNKMLTYYDIWYIM